MHIYEIVSLHVAVRWHQCRASRCQAPANRINTRRVACPRCQLEAAWVQWAWPWAWPLDRVLAHASNNGTMAIRAELRDRRATSLFTWDTAPGQPAVLRSPTTRRASISTIRTPARPVSVYRTHCIRCLHSSRWTTTTATMDNTLSSPPVMDYTRFCYLFAIQSIRSPIELRSFSLSFAPYEHPVQMRPSFITYPYSPASPTSAAWTLLVSIR